MSLPEFIPFLTFSGNSPKQSAEFTAFFVTILLIIFTINWARQNLLYVALSVTFSIGSIGQIRGYDARVPGGLLALGSNINFYFFYWAKNIRFFRHASKMLAERLELSSLPASKLYQGCYPNLGPYCYWSPEHISRSSTPITGSMILVVRKQW